VTANRKAACIGQATACREKARADPETQDQQEQARCSIVFLCR
jgi:hypothetical protein